jgi:hypothetical protein
MQSQKLIVDMRKLLEVRELLGELIFQLKLDEWRREHGPAVDQALSHIALHPTRRVPSGLQ